MMGEGRRDDLEVRLEPLWARARAGDEDAYRAALHLMAPHLRAYFGRRMGKALNDVEDLVQETLLAIHLKRHTHDPARPVTHWIYAIAKYKQIDIWRRDQRREAIREPLTEAIEAGASAREPEAATGRDIAILLDMLPETQRRAIQFTRIEGLSTAEAAGRIGISVSAVKTGVHRGLKRLAGLVRERS